MNQRALALDALRGYAIITMVLSATIISSILPGWMSHAQTPPPEHIFNPEIPGMKCTPKVRQKTFGVHHV